MAQPTLDSIFNPTSAASSSRPSLDSIFAAPASKPSLDDIFSGKAPAASTGGLQGMMNQAGSFAQKLIPAAVTAGQKAGLSTTPSTTAFNADITNPQTAPGGAVGAAVNAIGQGATKMVTEAGQGLQAGAQQIMQAGGSNEIGGAVSGVNEQGQQMSPTDTVYAAGQGAADVVTGTLKSLFAIPGSIVNAVPGGQQVMGAINDKISQGSTAAGNAFMAATGVDPNSDQGKILAQHFQNLGQLLTVEATEKAAPAVSDLAEQGVEAVKNATGPIVEGAKAIPGKVGAAINNFVSPSAEEAATVNPEEVANTKATTAKANVDAAIQEGIQKGIKPSVVSQRIPNYVDKVTNAVVDTVRNKENLTVTKPTGEVTTGNDINFKDLGARQAQQVVEQTKADVFQKYNDMAKQSGEKGLTIGNDNVVQELRSLKDNKALQIAAPKVVEYAQKLANRLELNGDMTPLEQQGIIQQFNGKMNDFYNKRGSTGSATAEVNAMALNLMRKNLDEGISSATDPGYQDLKNSYGNLETLRKDLEHRAAITGNKATVGLLQHMGNLTSAVELGKSILTGNVPGMLTGAAVKGITEWVKNVNSPDAAIGRMFSRVEDNVGDLPAKAPAVNTRLQLPEGRGPGSAINTPINLPSKMPLDQAAVDAANAAKLQQPGTAADLQGSGEKIGTSLMNSQAGGEVFEELKNAIAGKRIVNEGETTASWNSTFPDWIPEGLRERPLLDKVQQHILDNTVPKSGKVAELYDAVKAEIQKRSESGFGDFMSKLTAANPAQDFSEEATPKSAELAGTPEPKGKLKAPTTINTVQNALIPKELQPLAEEAQKFNTAEEFEKHIMNNGNLGKSPGVQLINLKKIVNTDYPELDAALKSGKKLSIEEAENIVSETDPYKKGQPIKYPIEVTKTPDGEYSLRAGNHRLAQALINGQKFIPANIIGNNRMSLIDFYNQVKAK